MNLNLTDLLQSQVIYQGDNLDFLRKLPNECIDAIITDPPFNTEKKQNKGDDTEYDDHWTWDKVDKDDLVKLEPVCPDAYQFITTAPLKEQPFLAMIGVRLYECYRILKSTGSLMVICDTHILGSLTTLLKHIFKYQNNIIAYVRKEHDGPWTKHSFSRNAYYILWFTKKNSGKFVANIPKIEYTEEEEYERQKTYKYIHPKTGERGKTGGHPLATSKNRKGKFYYKWNGKERYYEIKLETMQRLYDENKILHVNGNPYRFYTEDSGHNTMSDFWVDAKDFEILSEQKKHFRTAKPPALLERLVKTTTKDPIRKNNRYIPQAIVLDPFAGSGSTALGAARSYRHWISCESKEETVKCHKDILGRECLLRTEAIHIKYEDIAHIPDYNNQIYIELKKDRDNELLNKVLLNPTLRMQLYQEVKGICPHCKRNIEPDFATIDHIVPVSKDPSRKYDLTNLQMLCSSCNSRKGTKKNEVAKKEREQERALFENLD